MDAVDTGRWTGLHDAPPESLGNRPLSSCSKVMAPSPAIAEADHMHENPKHEEWTVTDAGISETYGASALIVVGVVQEVHILIVLLVL